MKYNVSMAIDARLNVEVEADSFEKAFEKARNEIGYIDWSKLEFIGEEPVCAEREDGVGADYGELPYED